MIKFIDLTHALNESKMAFAFYNIETEHFLSFFKREIWHSAEDFKSCLEEEKEKDSTLFIDEYLKLIPVSH